MNALGAAVPGWEFDAFGMSVRLALLAGALSVLVPWLVPGVGALVALAVAGWAAERSSARRSPGRVRASAVPSLALLAVGGLLFVGAGPPFPAFRGVVLSLAVVPLWLTGRAAGARPTAGR